MGADFNILEYADPELEQLTGGEKTNILDLDLEQDEVETKEEKQKKDVKEEDQKPKDIDGSGITDGSEMNATGTLQNSTGASNVLTQGQTMAPMAQSPQVTQQQQPTMMSQPHPQAAVVQQQMHQHVQQAAAMGRPMAPGTRLLSPDGAIGVVTSTNSVTVSYPSTFPHNPQRIPQQHMQGNSSYVISFRLNFN